MTVRIFTPEEADGYVAATLADQGLPLVPDPNCEAVRKIAAVVRRIAEAQRRSA